MKLTFNAPLPIHPVTWCMRSGALNVGLMKTDNYEYNARMYSIKRILYIDVLIVCCRYIFYHLQVTELFNNTVYIFYYFILPEDGSKQ
jgi:hypothetical protein